VRSSDGGAWWHAFFNAADGACALLSDGRITFWNAATEKITGYAVGEVVGRRCCEVFGLREARGERSCSSRCRSALLNKSNGPIESFDLQISSKSGRLIWINMSTVIAPVTDAHGPRVIRMFREVTALRDLLELIRNHLAGPPTTDDVLGRLTPTRSRDSAASNLRRLESNARRSTAHQPSHRPQSHPQYLCELGVRNRLAAVTLAPRQFQ
jgi:PAS domain S-box-containing protein